VAQAEVLREAPLMSKFDDLRFQRRKLEQLLKDAEEARAAIADLERRVDSLGPLMQHYRKMSKQEFRDHLAASYEVYEERMKAGDI
jgi:hypothetical protein